MSSPKKSPEAKAAEWKMSAGRSAQAVEELEKSDERQLARTGKKQVLKRRFGFVSMLGMSTTLMLTWEGELLYFSSGLLNGGPAGLVYSYLLSWAGVLAVMSCLAELSSMAPTAAGQYYWVSILAPKPFSRIASYVTGWLSVAVWQGVVTMTGYLCGTLIQGLIVLHNLNPAAASDPTQAPAFYEPKGWQATLLLWGAVLLSLCVNTVLAKHLPKIEGFILYIHLFGFFAILVPLLYLSERVPARVVFTAFSNGGQWPSTGIAFLVGMITNVGSLLGSDGAVHLSEEIHSASRIVPWSILITLLLNGTLGLGMLLTVLLCLTSPDAALASPTKYPFIQIFYDATKSTTGTTLMTVLILLLVFAAMFGQFASASRQLWSFARDFGVPFSSRLQYISPHSRLPLNAIYTTLTIPLLLGLIISGSSIALLNLLSFVTSAWLLAAFLPLSLLLWRRTTGLITLPQLINHVSTSSPADSPSAPLEPLQNSHEVLEWGPWRIPEPLGTVVNVFGLCWILVAMFFSFWPPFKNVTVQNMNYSALMTGFWVIFGLIWFAVWGRRTYKGPVVEVK
ncbi:amino acid transporter-like protein [Lindgomyces ingoldianus]|uniref:Amino acid transporter-like protein n=1 Tax=Lindgomyces ingoldianus TaxID=673940 RepID=A0ACB6R0S0_9PLEO|nr:amino acid transporter-like protein [Lindgomyces ingoldianus]KAF2472390.1 amino acid transporter-like protein [Lindgomyces ingoldianus]